MEPDEIDMTIAFVAAVSAVGRAGCEWEAYSGSDEGHRYLALGFGNDTASGELRVYHPGCVRIGAGLSSGARFSGEYATIDAGCLALTLLVFGAACEIDPDWRAPTEQDFTEAVRSEAVRISLRELQGIRVPGM
ncbi:MAG: hypothetical protein HQL34_07465 [Alphaproteobacteria bacterium]|nr:hypothetical protein [Alphaproteobacteria bacterium]